MAVGPLPRPQLGSSPASRLRRLAIAVTALVLFAAAGGLIARTIATSSARVAATTRGEGVLTAATVVLSQPDDTAQVLFDADGLAPGKPVIGCVEIEYSGSVPAAVRLHGDLAGGTGLEQYVELGLAVIPDAACPQPTELAELAELATDATELYRGRLVALSVEHATFDSGLAIATMSPGDRVAVLAEATIIDDNRAQGRTTDFSFTFEGRPA